MRTWTVREIGTYTDGTRVFALIDPNGNERMYERMEWFQSLLGDRLHGAIQVEYTEREGGANAKD